jgi:hypothetical protein
VGEATPVERAEAAVMYVEGADGLEGIGAAWQALEARLGSLRGRHFIGAFDGGRYRACVVLRPDDDPAALGLEVGVLPGGRYLRVRLRGEPPGLYERIGPTFDRLAAGAPVDEARPGLEWYRRHDEIDLLLPVLG